MAWPPRYRGWSRGAEMPRIRAPDVEGRPAPEHVPLVAPDLSRLIPGSAVFTDVFTVTTAGVREQLPDLPCRSVSIRALPTNTDTVYLGNQLVAAASGFPLDAGDTLDLAIDNLRRLYLDAAVDGEGVAYLVVN